MTKPLNLIGQTFGKLRVEQRVASNERGRTCWLCWCACGNPEPVITLGASLVSGKAQSCGCERRQNIEKAVTKHGFAREGRRAREYLSLHGAVQRCFNPNNKRYKDYGARLNQPMCDRYRYGEGGLSGVQCLIADIGRCPPGKTLGRINNNLGYLVGNVRWETDEEQAGNTQRNHRIPMPDGRVIWREQSGRELGLPAHKLTSFLHHAKESIANGATTPDRQATKVAIQVTIWMLLADLLKGTPDVPQAARTLARLVRGKDGSGLAQGVDQR